MDGILSPRHEEGREGGAWKGLLGRGEGESRLWFCRAPGLRDTGRPPSQDGVHRRDPLRQAHTPGRRALLRPDAVSPERLSLSHGSRSFFEGMICVIRN